MKSKYKKTALTVLCLLLSVCMSACTVTKPNEDEDNPINPPPSGPIYTVDEFVNELDKSAYIDINLTDTVYGLSAPENVGVNQVQAETPLYAINESDYSAECSVNAEDCAGANDTEKFVAAFAAAKTLCDSGKSALIRLPNREINLSIAASSVSAGSFGFSFSGYKNLAVLGGEKTVLMLDTGSSWRGGLQFVNCENLKLQSVRVDYKVAPTLTGIIKSSNADEKTITMEVPASMHENFVALKNNAALGGSLKSFIEYDRFTNAPKLKGNYMISSQNYFESVTFGEADGKDVITVKFTAAYKDFSAPRNNDKVALGFAMYGNNGINLSGGKNVYLEDCAVYTCPGMAFTSANTENLYVHGFDMTLKGDRLMTATADGLHFSELHGDVAISGCVLENSHDDAMNLKSGYYYTVSDRDSRERTFTIAKKTAGVTQPKAGDVLEFYDSKTFEHKGTFTVAEDGAGDSSAYVVKVKERIPTDVNFTSDCVVTNVSNLAKLTFENNIVRNKRNRGILVQTRGAVISNNTFQNVGHGAVMLHSSLDVFNEATLPRDMTVKNNKFLNNGYLLTDALRGDVAVFAYAEAAVVGPSGTITGTVIENNYFTRGGEAGISLRGAGGGAEQTRIKNNLFNNVSEVSSSENTECCIELDNTCGITVEGNYNRNTSGSETFSGIVTAGRSEPQYITLKDNVNIRYQEINGEIAKITVKKLSGDIVVDGDISDWAEVGTPIEMLASSVATGEEIAYDTYKDVFDIKMCKIAWTDSGIYIGFSVKDDKLDFAPKQGFWNGDCFELFISEIVNKPNADFQVYKDDGFVMQAAFGTTYQMVFGESRTNAELVAKYAQFAHSVVATADGYDGELFIPFAVYEGLKEKVAGGSPLAMAFIFADNDRDDIGRKRVQVGNVPHFVETYKTKTAKMPQFTFEE